MNPNPVIGFLTWWTVPDCAAPYQDLAHLAAQTGFPADCVPNPPAPRHAWEKATNVGGSRGLKLDAPVDLINQVFMRYGAEPVVRLLTRRVSESAPVLRRHLVREAVIAPSTNHERQLSLQTVAVLEFDVKVQRAAVDVVFDAEGWVNGNLHTILADIEDRRRALLHLADGNDIREGVRKLMVSLHRVALRGTGGVYFVPEAAPDAEQCLKSLRAYIKGLLSWKTGQLEPSCSVVRLHGDDAESLRDDILVSATTEFKARLSDLAEKVEPILQRRARGKIAERIAQSATEELLRIQSAVAAYRESLHDEFAALADMLHMAQAAVMQAMRLAD